MSNKNVGQVLKGRIIDPGDPQDHSEDPVMMPFKDAPMVIMSDMDSSEVKEDMKVAGRVTRDGDTVLFAQDCQVIDSGPSTTEYKEVHSDSESTDSYTYLNKIGPGDSMQKAIRALMDEGIIVSDDCTMKNGKPADLQKSGLLKLVTELQD